MLHDTFSHTCDIGCFQPKVQFGKQKIIKQKSSVFHPPPPDPPKKAQKTPTKPKSGGPPPFPHLHVMIVLIKASHKSSLRGITTFPP